MSDTFRVTLSARIRARYKNTFTIKKADFYAWVETYKKNVVLTDPDTDWEDLVSEYCEDYWDSLTDYPDNSDPWPYYDDEELEIEDDEDLTLPLQGEVQLHQETKLW